MLRVLGDHPEDKASVEICSGRYGPYARHGKINATLPKHILPDEITLTEALELISAKAAKSKPAKSPAKKPTAKKNTQGKSEVTKSSSTKKAKSTSTKVGKKTV